MNKKYEKTGSLDSAQFSLNDLVELGDCIIKDMSGLTRPLRITVRQSDGEIEIKGHQKLIEVANIVDTIREMTFSATSDTLDENYRPIQNVFLIISKTQLYLSVSGINDSWVRGNFERIKDFLQTKATSLGYRSCRPLFYVALVSSGLLFLFNLFLAARGSYIHFVSAGAFLIVYFWLLSSNVKVVSREWLPHTVLLNSVKGIVDPFVKTVDWPFLRCDAFLFL